MEGRRERPAAVLEDFPVLAMGKFVSTLSARHASPAVPGMGFAHLTLPSMSDTIAVTAEMVVTFSVVFELIGLGLLALRALR